MRTIIFIIAALFAVSSQAQNPTPIFNLTTTNSAAGSNWIAIVTHPGQTNGTRKINLTNLATALGPYITNTVAANPAYNGEVAVTNATRIGLVYGKSGDTNLLRSISAGANVVLTNEGTNIVIASTASGSGSGLVTNANQFGASTTLTIKSSPTLTNINSYGVLQALGQIDAEGGVMMGNLTASRALVLNGSGDITNSASVDTTEIEYLDGATNNIQSQINSAMLRTFSRTIWVSSTGSDASAEVNNAAKPFATIQAAFSNITSRTKVIILPGSYTLPVQFDRSGGVDYPPQRTVPAHFQDVTNVTIEGWGFPNVQATSQGTMVGISNVAHVTISGIYWSGVYTNGIISNHTNNLGILTMYGSNRYVDIVENTFKDTEGFAIHGGNNATSWRTDNMRVFKNTFIKCGHTNFSYFNGANSPEGGLMQIAGDDCQIEGNSFERFGRGIEWFGSGGSDVFKNLVIANNSFVRSWSRSFFADAGGNYQHLVFSGNYFRDNQDHTVANSFGEARLNLTRVKNVVFKNNIYDNCIVNMMSFGEGAAGNTEGALIIGNTFDTLFRGIDLMNDAGPAASYATVANNYFRRCTNYTVRVSGRNHVIRGNTFVDCGSAANNGVIWLRASDQNCINALVEDNTIMDSTNGTWTSYGIRLESSAVINPRIRNNRILAYQNQPIWDGGSVGPFIDQSVTNGFNGFLTGTNTPRGVVDINGTNRANYYHLRGGQATNSLVYIDGTTNLGVVTIGANLTLTAGTLAASGGSASTNNPVQAAGWLQVTQAIAFVGSGGTLIGTNMTYSNTLARSGSLFTNVFASTSGGVTNLLFDIADGSSIEAWIWASNGVTARLPQFTADQYVGNPTVAPAIGTNAWTRIRVTRLNTTTNVELWTKDLELGPGNMISLTTNNATSVVTVNVGNSVLTNLAANAATTVTNESTAALQINSGTLSLTPGVVSNLVSSTIDVQPGNIVTNIGALRFGVWTNYVQTVSNFVFDFKTNRYELKNQTNVVFTNIVEEATAVGADLAVHIHNTTGVTMGLVWPSYGAQHGYFFQTNANNAILSTTSLASGSHGILSLTAFGTNIFATFTTWP